MGEELESAFSATAARSVPALAARRARLFGALRRGAECEKTGFDYGFSVASKHASADFDTTQQAEIFNVDCPLIRAEQCLQSKVRSFA
jgi:hypothetical protein